MKTAAKCLLAVLAVFVLMAVFVTVLERMNPLTPAQQSTSDTTEIVVVGRIEMHDGKLWTNQYRPPSDQDFLAGKLTGYVFGTMTDGNPDWAIVRLNNRQIEKQRLTTLIAERKYGIDEMPELFEIRAEYPVLRPNGTYVLKGKKVAEETVEAFYAAVSKK